MSLHIPSIRPAAALSALVARGRAWCLAGAVGLLAGCASPPPPALAPLLDDDAYPAPAQPLLRADALFAASPAMRAFLEADSHRAAMLRDPRRALLDALYRTRSAAGDGLRLEYDSAITRTAAEAFEARTGNCLSLVIMTAAFARELGLAVSFQAVDSDTYLSRVGSLVLASGHVNVVIGPPLVRSRHDRSDSQHLVVDFLAERELRGLQTRPLSPATIVAMYFNNRAAELLGEGRVAPAYWHAREALQHDPAFGAAVNTLGLVHLRAGLHASAERAFREVLARDPRSVAALGNLLGLLQAQGRHAEAAPLSERLAALQPVPPFHWLHAGREALAAGDPATALSLLRKELNRQPEQDEVHFALAEAHWRLGDLARARHHLARAAEFSPRRADQRRYEAKLSWLRGAAQEPATP